jgi:hypothetical protein
MTACDWRPAKLAAVALVVLIVAAVLGGPGRAAAQPPPTQVITDVAVDAAGQPINGYREMSSQGNVAQVNQCPTSSPAAVSNDIYQCYPTAAGADVCWPAGPGSLLCANDPWARELHRVQYPGVLPDVSPPATPEPFALVLDDGTRCRLRNGGAWGAGPDGYVGAYGCEPPAKFDVLGLPNASAIDRSAPVWTVKVGVLGTPGTPLPPPQTRNVTTAWLAGR